MSEMVEMQGTIEDVFGHRFTLKTNDGKHLVDLGPHGAEMASPKAGERVTVKGDRKPSELKAKSIRIGDGDWTTLHKDNGQAARDDHEVSDEDVDTALAAGGYSDPGERTRKPKHVEVVATKDGAKHKLHIHKNGEIKKADPVN